MTRRRCVLHYLQTERRASLTEIATQLAAREHEIPSAAMADEDRDDPKTRLYHDHLPTLHEMRLIEYDRRSETIVVRDPPALVDRCLEHCAPADLPT